MRISLLEQREPFAKIFESTVKKFLENYYHQEFTVKWLPDRNIDRNQKFQSQLWYCNAYLNMLFCDPADSEIFDPIIREFSHSVSLWKRPIQWLYVTMATSNHLRSVFSRSTIHISPPINDAEFLLFIGGNHKIRLLDFKNKHSYGILKEGFSDFTFQNEISSRELATQLGLPVPNLLHFEPEQLWFLEEYVSGTPLNRLDKSEQEKAINKAIQYLQLMWQSTEEEINTTTYLSSLKSNLLDKLERVHLFSSDKQLSIENLIKALTEKIEIVVDAHQIIKTVISHGDFQPANILVNSGGLWIIDWEYSTRRFREYDLLVFSLQSRKPSGLASRLTDWVKLGDVENHFPYQIEMNYRKLIAILFLLEDLDLQLQENSNTLFTQVGTGLLTVISEIQIWLDTSVDILE